MSAKKNRTNAAVRVTENKQTNEQGSNTSISDSTESDGMSSFEDELYWCVQELQAGLSMPKKDQKKVKEAQKVLKSLQNPKTSFVKKRVLMKITFGDYRKKMQEEAHKHKKKVPILSIADQSQKQKSVFYKQSIMNKISNTKPDQVIDFSKSQSETFSFSFDIEDTSLQSENQDTMSVNHDKDITKNSTDNTFKESYDNRSISEGSCDNITEQAKLELSSEDNTGVNTASDLAVYFKSHSMAEQFQFGFKIEDGT